jgi:hypothetical protein
MATTKTLRDANIEVVENETAVVLDGLDSLRELWLFLRALERRGLVEQGDAVAAQQDLERIQRALGAARRRLAADRSMPVGGM